MQFLTSLFGGSENTILTAVLALAIVLVLILLGLWIVKALFTASSNLGRGRSRRLNVVDSVAVDARRRLLIVRRDNVEHLILTGGPHDVVIETNIPVERQTAGIRRPAPAMTPPQQLENERPAAGAARQFAPSPTVRTPLERLRDLGRPAGQRKSASLRHTGLMRPVSRMETAVIPMNPDRTDNPGVDSATTGAQGDTNGQTRLGARGYFRDVSESN